MARVTKAASACGAGIVNEGVVSVTIGTSGVVFASIDHMPQAGAPGISPLLERSFCHALPETWHYMGVMLSAGGSLRWFRDVVAYGDASLVQRQTSSRDPTTSCLSKQRKHPPALRG